MEQLRNYFLEESKNKSKEELQELLKVSEELLPYGQDEEVAIIHNQVLKQLLGVN